MNSGYRDLRTVPGLSRFFLKRPHLTQHSLASSPGQGRERTFVRSGGREFDPRSALRVKMGMLGEWERGRMTTLCEELPQMMPDERSRGGGHDSAYQLRVGLGEQPIPKHGYAKDGEE